MTLLLITVSLLFTLGHTNVCAAPLKKQKKTTKTQQKLDLKTVDIKKLFKFFGLPEDTLTNPPDEVLDVFMGPTIDRMVKDDNMRRRFMNYMRRRMGESNWKDFQYKSALESTPNMGPLKARILRNQIYGRQPIFRRRR